MENSHTKYPWGHSRPFNAYSNYFKIKYGERLQKLSIDAGFSCPNRDGKISFGGCSFCDNNAFNPSYCPNKTIYQQIEEGISFHSWRYKNVKNYLAYFQAYSNTYAPLEVLKQRYEEALSHPNIIGLVIGTRPDCVDNQVLDYLQELSEKHIIILEFGIESCYNQTLKRINRGHSFEKSVWAIEESAKRGITTGGHLIFGLPGESIEMMLDEAKILSELPLHSIKFHQLILVKNTPIIKDWKENPEDFVFMKFEQYKEFMIDFLEKLSPHIVIERFAGEVPPRFQEGGSNWELLRNETLVQKIEKRMIERNTYQGRLFK